jgi:hypothetical protein
MSRASAAKYVLYGVSAPHHMIWILWAVMLVTHGAFSRWVRTAPSYAKASVLGDVLLIAIGLMTVDQLQGVSILDVLRIGLFFVAFATAGRQLMASCLRAN